MLLSYASLVKQYGVNVTGVIHVGGHIGQEMETTASLDLSGGYSGGNSLPLESQG